MSLDLDKRQRAMLREMGIRVWQPLPAAPVPASPASESAAPASSLGDGSEAAPVTVAAAARPAGTGTGTGSSSAQPPRAAPVPVPASSPEQVAERPVPGRVGAATAWHVGPVRALHEVGEGQTAPSGPRWLLLMETADEAALTDPLAGDVGRLLANMLHAARLRGTAPVWLVPVARTPGASQTGAVLQGVLNALVAQYQPQVLLLMGRLVAQALLASTEPLGKLRGQVHALADTPTVVSYDVAALLRTPTDKAKAWDDWCLALHTVQATAQGQKQGTPAATLPLVG